VIGKVRAGDRPMIGHVGVGLGNRSDSPAYDISTVEKFKNTLLGADMVVFNSVKSGEALPQRIWKITPPAPRRDRGPCGAR
jgi:molybdate transport system substrate-binding protein